MWCVLNIRMCPYFVNIDTTLITPIQYLFHIQCVSSSPVWNSSRADFESLSSSNTICFGPIWSHKLLKSLRYRFKEEFAHFRLLFILHKSAISVGIFGRTRWNALYSKYYLLNRTLPLIARHECPFSILFLVKVLGTLACSLPSSNSSGNRRRLSTSLSKKLRRCFAWRTRLLGGGEELNSSFLE